MCVYQFKGQYESQAVLEFKWNRQLDEWKPLQ
jgi:hypothetical protein